MYNKLRRIAARNLVNIYGWKTDRKIVVIERRLAGVGGS